MKKRIFCFVMFALLTLAPLGSALAGTSVGGSSYGQSGSSMNDRILAVPDFKFKIYENGIGYGTCPVYTAPSEQAYRANNGKAVCATNSYIGEAGYVSGWLLVRYETNNGGYRVGYIPPSYVRGFRSGMETPKFDYIPVTANGTIYVTDNPLLTGSRFAMLDPGETFYILGKYTYIGDWWYIECTVDGQVARGFIDRTTSSFSAGSGTGSVSVSSPVSASSPISVSKYGPTYTIPSISPLGTGRIADVLISTGTGERKIVRQNADPYSPQVSVAYPGTRYPCYAVKTGTTGKDWYYIWVESDSAWGWVSSGVSEIYY